MYESAKTLIVSLLLASAGAVGASAAELQTGTVPGLDARFERGAWSGLQMGHDPSQVAIGRDLRYDSTKGTIAFGETTGSDGRLVYFTPSFGGLSFSFGPAAVEDRAAALRLTPPGLDSTTSGWTAGLSVDRRIGGLQLWSGGSLTTTPASPVTAPYGDADTMRVGAGVGYGGLKLGGTYETALGNQPVDTAQRHHGFDLGASYEVGPFTTGLSWSRGVYNDFFSTGGRTSTTDELMLSLSYRMWHGVDLIGALQFDSSDKNGSLPGRDDSSAFIFGTAIRF